MTTWFSASAVIPQLREEWGVGRTGAAWLTIAVQLGFVTGALASSLVNLADVVSPRLVILAGTTGAAAVNALLAAAHGLGVGIPLRFGTGFFLAGVYPPALKLMSTWFRAGRGTALGIVVGALTLGSAGPHLVNGLGGPASLVVVYATSAVTLAGGAVAWLGVPEGPFPFPRAVFDPRQTGRVLHNRGVRLASLGYFGHMWELYAMWAWFLVFFRAAAAAGRGAAYATFAVIGLLLDAPSWLVLLVGLVWGFTVVADSAQFSTMVTELADQAYVGTALTLQLAVGFALTAATIWLVPLARDAVGWPWTFVLLVPGPALGVLAMLRLRARPEARRIAGGL